MAAAGSFDGMKQLMEAEKKASAIVADARKQRQDRLASAKKDAANDIARYREEKEAEFQRLSKERLGNPDDQNKELREQAEQDVRVMDKEFNENKEAVLDMLMEAVTNVQVSVPESWRLQKELGYA